MKDNCIICGKHLQTRIAKSEGVGPECKKGFSRKIRICKSISVNDTLSNLSTVNLDGFFSDVQELKRDTTTRPGKSFGGKI